MPTAKKTIKKETKKSPKKSVSKKKEVKKETPVSEDSRYIESIGRRKKAVARVRIWTKGKKEFLVNQKPFNEYFSTLDLQEKAQSALTKMNCLDKFKISALVKGGGINAQAEAIRHGISRALVTFNDDFKKRLKKAGFLTRDPRMRERKKFGLKRARRAPQWRKR